MTGRFWNGEFRREISGTTVWCPLAGDVRLRDTKEQFITKAHTELNTAHLNLPNWHTQDFYVAIASENVKARLINSGAINN